MSNIVPATSRALVRQDRETGRALVRLDAQTQLGLAAIESRADMQEARVMAVGHVGRTAMQEVALLSQVEQQLSTIVPSATTRLQGITDIIALQIVEIVADTKYELYR